MFRSNVFRIVRPIAVSYYILQFCGPTQLFGQDAPFVTTAGRIRLLSANDGELQHVVGTFGRPIDREKKFHDSVTVIDLSPNEPPVVRTVFDTVPSTAAGPPYAAMSRDGTLGFVANHGWRRGIDLHTEFSKLPPGQQNQLTVIDLQSSELSVIQRIELAPFPWMVVRNPKTDRIVVCCGREILSYEVEGRKLTLASKSVAPIHIVSFDVSPQGDRLIATGIKEFPEASDTSVESDFEIHAFAIRGEQVVHLSRVGIDSALGRIHGPTAARFSPDGRWVLALNGLGRSGKGTLDDVLAIDMSLQNPRVTQVVPQVADGLESVAFHPSGHMAVVTCLGNNPEENDAPTFSRLAVIDMKSVPIRLLHQMRVEPWPEGIEFTPDGKKLFVGCTFASHIAVFNVEGYFLRRSQFVLQTGYGHASMAIAPLQRQ